MRGDQRRISRFLSLVLRHKPEKIGLNLNANGWVQVDELIEKAEHAGLSLSRPLLEKIVQTNDKKRFCFSPDGKMIRANQGHSIPVDLGLQPQEPPAVLYHGTASRFIESISRSGINPMGRQFVHLSLDKSTALKVGARHGAPIVVSVLAGQMHAQGLEFYLSDNNVWLTRFVPPGYLDIP